MKAVFILALATLLGLGTARAQTSPAPATPSPPPSAPPKRSAADLEKLAMPIALHPDPLISILLPAAAYPIEVVQAARFVKDTNNISKLDEQPWDDNVKAVAKFPELIARMDADLAWTVQLGQAFVDQPKELMDAIQSLRSKAQKAGNLKTTDQQIVTITNVVVLQTNITEVVTVNKEIIEVVPASPSVVYVPSYPPTIYYPWYPYYTYAAPAVAFGVGFAWGVAWGAVWHNHCNWHGGSVDIDIDRNINIDRDRNRVSTRDTARTGDRMSNTGRDGAGRQQWKPNQNRMRQSGTAPGTREARGWGSSGTRPSTANLGARPSTGNPGARPSSGNFGTRPSGGNVGTRPSTAQSFNRSSSYGNRSSSTSAFNRSSGGSSSWSSSYRGSSSRGGGGFSGGRGGGRGGGGGRRR